MELSASMKSESPLCRYTCCKSKVSWIREGHNGDWKQNRGVAAEELEPAPLAMWGVLETGGS